MDKNAKELWNNSIPKWTKEIKAFGEIGVIKTPEKEGKLKNKGATGMMVGYMTDMASKVYRMYNLRTGNILLVRDIR